MAGNPSDLCVLADVKSWLSIPGATSDTVLQTLITAVSRGISSWLGHGVSLYATVYNEMRNGSGTRALTLLKTPAFAINSLSVGTIPVQMTPNSLGSGWAFDSTTVYLQGYPSGSVSGGNMFFGPLRFPGPGWQQNVQINYSAGYAAPNQWNPGNWATAMPYLSGSTILPTANNVGAFVQVCMLAGTSGGSAPTWNQTPGGLTKDGTVTWANLNVTSLPCPFPDGRPNDLPMDITEACIEWVSLRFKEKERIGQISSGFGGEQTIQYIRGPMPPAVQEILQTYKRHVPVSI